MLKDIFLINLNDHINVQSNATKIIVGHLIMEINFQSNMHVNISDTFTLRGFNSTLAPGFRKTLGTQFHHGDNNACKYQINPINGNPDL